MKKIQLTQNKWAIVDDEDFLMVSNYNYYYRKQTIYSKGYAIRGATEELDGYKKKTLFLHQDIAKAKYGNYDTSKLICDHINRDSLDCRRKNIRLVTASENNQNRKVFKDKTKSKYKGVYKRQEPRKTWLSTIALQGKVYYLGDFKTEKEAALAYNKKAKELYGEFANLNKIEG